MRGEQAGGVGSIRMAAMTKQRRGERDKMAKKIITGIAWVVRVFRSITYVGLKHR